MDGLRLAGCFDTVEMKPECQCNPAIKSHPCRRRAGTIEACKGRRKGDEDMGEALYRFIQAYYTDVLAILPTTLLLIGC